MSNPPPFFRRQFLAPRYWPVWLGIGALRALIALPFAWQIALGTWLGRLLARLPTQRRQVAAVNLALCFPELSDAERKALLVRHFESLGISLFEIGLSWWDDGRRLRALVEVEGMEHLHAALARGKGVLLLSAHFTTLEISCRLLALHAPIDVLYRADRNPLVNTFMQTLRTRHIEQAIEDNDVRTLLRRLKQNHAVWYTPDQNYARQQRIFVPFFGVRAATITATTRLARVSGAAVVPFFHQRLPGARGYKLWLLPALDDFPGDTPEGDALRINRLFEEWIRRMPEQYLWVHRRFRKRPRGEPRVYPR